MCSPMGMARQAPWRCGFSELQLPTYVTYLTWPLQGWLSPGRAPTGLLSTNGVPDHLATRHQSRGLPMKPAWIALMLGVTLAGTSHAQAAAAPDAAAAADPYLWLEDVHADRPMEWVKQQNAITARRFVDTPTFGPMRDRILEVLDSDARIPYVNRMGGYLYNFWRDQQHPRGLWRRTTLDEYRKAEPRWDVVLDVDSLDKAEGKRWVFKGAECLQPQYTRCLISLSPEGGDAVTVREFDIPSRTFVKDGFELPVAKSNVGWIDENTLYVGTDFGPGSMTTSSYP